MITVATLLWQTNHNSQKFSSMYNEEWVERLYRGFARNLTKPFQFVCYVDRPRKFSVPVTPRLINSRIPSYADCIQPFEMGVPMILVGLDTIVTGNIDHLADYCLNAETLALPRDPFDKEQACNGVCLVPAGLQAIAGSHGKQNDMVWLRSKPHVFIDDLYPGHVESYKGAVRDQGLGDTRIVYFHGKEKPHELPEVQWISDHWR